MNSSNELLAKGHLVCTFIRGIYLITESDVKENLKNYGVSFTGFRLLWILYFEKKLTMTDLAYISQTNISNIYRQLLKLSDQNLVVIVNGKDARIKETSLSETGRKFISDILSVNIKITNLHLIHLLARIPKEDLDKFIEIASILSTELIGQRYTDWAIKTANKIMENEK
jgi:DNA-binding MarR family transcriptional regulator